MITHNHDFLPTPEPAPAKPTTKAQKGTVLEFRFATYRFRTETTRRTHDKAFNVRVGGGCDDKANPKSFVPATYALFASSEVTAAYEAVIFYMVAHDLIRIDTLSEEGRLF